MRRWNRGAQYLAILKRGKSASSPFWLESEQGSLHIGFQIYEVNQRLDQLTSIKRVQIGNLEELNRKKLWQVYLIPKIQEGNHQRQLGPWVRGIGKQSWKKTKSLKIDWGRDKGGRLGTLDRKTKNPSEFTQLSDQIVFILTNSSWCKYNFRIVKLGGWEPEYRE